jgi:hypothetical protein
VPTRRRRNDTHGPDDGKATAVTPAHVLTSAQRRLLSYYEALRPEHRRAVEDLLREFSKLPAMRRRPSGRP